MKIILFPVISFFSGMFAACASLHAPENLTISINPVMRTVIFEFLEDCEKVLNTETCKPKLQLEGGFKKLDKDLLGTCYVYETPSYLREIYIDPEVTDPNLFRVVMYHELMHCILGTEHTDNELDIMNSRMDQKSADYIANNWDNFVKQALTREQK